MLKRIALAALLFVSVPVAAANAQSFLFGLAVGGMMFGGGGNNGGSAATILYTADEETLKAINPLDVRLVANKKCFADSYNHVGNKTVGELFSSAIEDDTKKRTILQIARVFDAGNPHCAAIWFAYVEE